jgi:hypothetical protein
MRRLADAKDHRFPRDVLCLFAEGMNKERDRMQQGQRTASDTVISRESLAAALQPTSAQRVAAVREEYPELVDALGVLTGMAAQGDLTELKRQLAGIDPALDRQSAFIETLTKAGIVETERIGTSDRATYEFPALYFHGLGMTRPGPK